MPFRDPGGGDLATRIETELRERLEEALDAACLDTLVKLRETRGLPSLRADSPVDRAAYQAEMRRLLERLDAQIDDPGPASGREPGSEPADAQARLMARQVALARALPDYWQRFESARLEYTGERMGSGGESRTFLGRLFGRA